MAWEAGYDFMAPPPSDQKLVHADRSEPIFSIACFTLS
jgi:hypothetical protein